MAARGVDYAPHEIDKALTTLAYYGGNTGRASRELGMSASTLKLWRSDTHRDRYLEIAEREGPKLEQIAAQQARELILRANETEHDLLDALSTVAGDPTQSKISSELAGALQRTTTSKGINTTKLLELTGRPTQIVEHRDPKQAALALARRLGVALDSTAEDITTPVQTTTDLALLPESASANVRESTAPRAPAQPRD